MKAILRIARKSNFHRGKKGMLAKDREKWGSRALLCGTASWVAAVAATPAAAQTVPTPAPVQLPTATVETSPPPPFKAETVQSPKFTEPLLDTPKTINVIPKEVIQQRGATSINEVLRQVPGISLGAAEGGLAAGDRTFIRGYEARGDTFVDGFRDGGASAVCTQNVYHFTETSIHSAKTYLADAGIPVRP